MIFVSSTCVKHSKIADSVLELANLGYKNIELTGGTQYYPTYLEDLIKLKNEFNLNYRLHNYFPPPQKHFVMNLASMDEKILSISRNMVKEAIDQSQLFGSEIFGLHAGFRINPSDRELGQQISFQKISDFSQTMEIFVNEVRSLVAYGQERGVKLYLENNVFSLANSKSFNGENPFFLTCNQEFQELKKVLNFSLLLDVAHLKVSCQTLGLNFEEEIEILLPVSDYLHLSDNDGTADSNQGLEQFSDLYKILGKYNLRNKSITLEIYSGPEALKQSYELVELLLGK